ncbi:MAG: CDP-alcohol phosphatidyltransferase family protein [Bacilli bacterium]|nr:CDP-alcohol phosphatidyltransferase family protein [Bacilli bacterium]
MKKFVNLLTILRIIATLILPVIWHIFDSWTILIFVSIILLTDFFDGFLARTFHVQSLFGSVADSVADKVFGIVILLIVAAIFPVYYVLVIFECVIASINIYAALRGATTKSTFLGKFKMWLLGLSTVFGLIIMFESSLVSYDISLINLVIENKDVLLVSSVLVTSGSELMVVLDYSRHIIKELRREKPQFKYRFKDDERLMYVLFDTEYFLSHKELPLSKHLLK